MKPCAPSFRALVSLTFALLGLLAMAGVQPAHAVEYELGIWNDHTGASYAFACHSIQELEIYATVAGLLYPVITEASVTVYTEHAFNQIDLEAVDQLVTSLHRCPISFTFAGPLSLRPDNTWRFARLAMLLRSAYRLPLLDADGDEHADDGDDGDGRDDGSGPGSAGAAPVLSGSTSTRRGRDKDGKEGEGRSGKKPCLHDASARSVAGTVPGANLTSLTLAEAVNVSHLPALHVPVNDTSCRAGAGTWTTEGTPSANASPRVDFSFLSSPDACACATALPASGASGAHRSAW